MGLYAAAGRARSLARTTDETLQVYHLRQRRRMSRPKRSLSFPLLPVKEIMPLADPDREPAGTGAAKKSTASGVLEHAAPPATSPGRARVTGRDAVATATLTLTEVRLVLRPEHPRRPAGHARAASASRRSRTCSRSIPPALRLNRPLDVPPALSEIELTRHVQQLAAPQPAGGRRRLLPRRRQLRPLHPRRRRCRRRPQRVLHRLHALPGRGQPGQLAGVLRVPDAHLPADRPRRGQRQPLRGRQRRRRGGAHGPDASPAAAARSSSPRASTPSTARRWRPTSPTSTPQVDDAADAATASSTPTT